MKTFAARFQANCKNRQKMLNVTHIFVTPKTEYEFELNKVESMCLLFMHAVYLN